MKKLYSIALFLISLSITAQAPQAINYQGVARNTNGTPITGAIAVKVDIHQGTGNGPVICNEVFHVSTNQFGIFDLRIGTMSPGQFGAIQWGTAKFFVGIAIDPTGGSTFGAEITNQELVSVPYALYAEKSGGAGPTTTITSTNPSIINVLSAPPSHTVIYTPPQLQLTNDSVLRIVQGTYSSSVVYLKGTQPPPTNTASANGPWNTAGSNVFLASPLNNVGIGTSGPAAKLEVSANPFSTNNAVAAYAQGGNGVLALTSSTNTINAAVLASNSGGGSGIVGSTGALNGVSAGVQGNHNGNGPGVYGSNTSNATTGTAHGVVGETNSGNNTAAGVIGINSGSGPGIYGYQGQAGGGAGVWGVSSSNSQAGIHGVSYGGQAGVFGDVGIPSPSGSAYGVFGRTNSSNANVAGVHGYNNNAGYGVTGVATSSTNAVAGVFGNNLGAGHGVMGVTSSNSFTSCGVYGRNASQGVGVFGEASTTTTLIAAVHGNQLGMGPALRGSLPTASAAGMPNVALLVENGHIWATSATPPTLTFANSSGTNVPLPTLALGSNDVRGMVLANVTSTANWSFNGFIDVTIHFHKPYMSGGPWVTITKYDQTSDYAYELQNITTTNFTVRIRNTYVTQKAPGVTQMKFTYMVMQ